MIDPKRPPSREEFLGPGAPVYREERRTVLVYCDETGAFPGLRAEIVALTWDEAQALAANMAFLELIELIAPHVVSWNYQARDATTGAHVPLPPPAEGGPAILQRVPMNLVGWLRAMLVGAPFSQDHPLELDPPAKGYEA